MTYAYFYYPFVGDTFRRVVANIVASLDRNPRLLTIIYAVTEMESVILDTGRFRRPRTRRIRDVHGIPHRISVYESLLTALHVASGSAPALTGVQQRRFEALSVAPGLC
jgi:hypothetical protein